MFINSFLLLTKLTTMKKIYLFLTMLFGLFGLNNASAQVSEYEPDEQFPLILLVDQFSSPYSDTGEGNFYSLLDLLSECPEDQHPGNDFWHSNWHNGDQPAGTHYFQVEMLDLEGWNDAAYETIVPAYVDFNDGEELKEYPEMIMFRFTRRSGADNDHTTEWCVMGTDDPDATKAECEELAYIETPFGSTSETLDSPAFPHKGYKYLRFYSEKQYPSSRGYFHLSRFQLYPALEKAEEDAALEMLSFAYDKYSEPVEIYRYLTGEEPGMYGQDEFDDFEAAVEALLDENVYTKAAAQALIDAADAAYEALIASRNLNYSIPSGYYFVKQAMIWKDGTDKYLMGGINDNNVLRAEWSDFDYYEEAGKPEEGKARMLWRVDAMGDGTYEFVNMFKNGRFTNVRSTNSEVPMTTLITDTLLVIEPVYTGDESNGETWVNLRMNKASNDDGTPSDDFTYRYLHAGGHNNGGGSRGVVMGWAATFDRAAVAAKASEWQFEPVSDAEAEQIISDWAVLNDLDSQIREIRQMCAEGKQYLEVAKDIQTLIDEDQPIVSDENPVSSPCSDSAEGQHIEYLWDNKGDTFWHTDWHGNFGAEDHHYLQVEIPEGVDLPTAAFRITRRNTTSGNQINKWTVWGTNDVDCNDEYEGNNAIVDEPMVQGSEGLEKLADLTTPYVGGQNTATITSDVFETKGYKYLRFYCAGTCNNDGSQGGNEKFFHIAEFQLYPAQVFQSETCQYNVMGEIATNLEELIAKFDEMEDEEITTEDYKEMKAAFDAFIAFYADPAELRSLIAEANKNLELVVIGTDPGFWSGESAAGALVQTVEEAEAYVEAGAYTPERVKAFEDALSAQTGDILASANPIKTGKWYRIRFGTEEEYDQYGWSKEGNAPNYEIDNSDEENPDTLGMYNAGNYGKYIAVAKRTEVEFEKADGSETKGNLIEPIDLDEIMIDKSIFGIDLEKLTDPDMALWRFVSIGDSAYAIQNKATGLFIHNGVYLSVQPGLFTQHPSGYGQQAFFHKAIDGSTKAPLHLAQSQTVLCAWGNESGSGWTDADGRRGSFFVEEVEDVAADYTFGEFQMSLTPGDIYGRCYPVPVTLKSTDDAQLWSVASIERTPGDASNNENVKVTFCKIDPEVPAGRPFFIVVNGDMPEDGEEYDPVLVKFGFEFDLINTPQTSDYLKGAFLGKAVGERCLTTGSGHEDGALEWKASDWSVSDNRVYITDIDESAGAFQRKAVLEVDFDSSIVDGVNGVLNKIAQTDDIYTLDGRHVGRGNINTLSRMGKGIYIINGVKVAVK